jgi:hypothetical protein
MNPDPIGIRIRNPDFRAMFLNDMMEASMNEIRIHPVEPSGT